MVSFSLSSGFFPIKRGPKSNNFSWAIHTWLNHRYGFLAGLFFFRFIKIFIGDVIIAGKLVIPWMFTETCLSEKKDSKVNFELTLRSYLL